MMTKLLFPHSYKLAGWCLLIPATILGLIISFTGLEFNWLNTRVLAIFPGEFLGTHHYFSIIHTNLTNTIVGILFIAGGMLVTLSKEKREDECIAKIRLSSLLWAVCLNYSLLLIAFLVAYDTAFLTVMVYNMFTVLLIFIIRFNYLMYKGSKIVSP